ncbi:uncharacterized protein LOC142803614 isoform X2 [Rhipicephalus microplus]|uniref:uncharacterized protein LOC142803614 isoform X2 n=1 Tax=Rhipicephalus microplus TaxID=6941 RepID=UPI003F6B284D
MKTQKDNKPLRMIEKEGIYQICTKFLQRCLQVLPIDSPLPIRDSPQRTATGHYSAEGGALTPTEVCSFRTPLGLSICIPGESRLGIPPGSNVLPPAWYFSTLYHASSRKMPAASLAKLMQPSCVELRSVVERWRPVLPSYTPSWCPILHGPMIKRCQHKQEIPLRFQP